MASRSATTSSCAPGPRRPRASARRQLPDLKEAERTEVLAAHRRHKQTVMLLHWLAMTLGAIDETDPTWILHPRTRRSKSTFSDRNRELMSLAIDARLAEDDRPGHREEAARVDREGRVGRLGPASTTRSRSAAQRDRRRKAGKTAADVPPAAYDQFTRIGDAREAGQDRATRSSSSTTCSPRIPATRRCTCSSARSCSRPRRRCAGRQGHGARGVSAPRVQRARARRSVAAPRGRARRCTRGRFDRRAHGARRRRGQDREPAAGGRGVAPLIGDVSGMGALTGPRRRSPRRSSTSDPVAARSPTTRARYGVPRGAKFVAPEQEARARRRDERTRSS